MYDTQVIPVPGRCMRGVEVAGLHGPTPTGAVQLSTWTVHSSVRKDPGSHDPCVSLYKTRGERHWRRGNVEMHNREEGCQGGIMATCTSIREMVECSTIIFEADIFSAYRMLGLAILNLAGVLFVFALTFTFVAYRRPSGPQPAAYCHVQTNCEPDRQIVTRDVVGGQTHVQLPVAHCSFDKRVQVMFHSRRLESRTRFVPTGAVGGHRYSSDELDNKAHSERFPETSSTEVASRLVAVLPLFPGSMELITFALMHTADQGRQIKEYQWNDVPLPFTTRSSKSNTQRLGFDLITEVFHPQSERTCAKIPQGHPGASTLELRRDSRRRPRALYYGPLHRQTQAHPREYVLQTNEIAYCAEKGVALTASGPRLRLELQESEELSSPLVVFLDMRRHRTFEVRR
ncbi:hypothetical protein J3A83DRAFT_4399275 [Scleroderma citrinum]